MVLSSPSEQGRVYLQSVSLEETTLCGFEPDECNPVRTWRVVVSQKNSGKKTIGFSVVLGSTILLACCRDPVDSFESRRSGVQESLEFF